MKKTVLLSLCMVLLLASCQLFNSAPKGYHHVVCDKKIELNVPDAFSIRKDSLYHMNPAKKHDMQTFKFLDKSDTSNFIGVAFSKNAESQLSIDKFLNNISMEAAQSPMVKLKGNDTMNLNGTKCGVVTYTLMRDTAESDYSRLIFTVINKEIYTCNLYFKGAVKPEYAATADVITKSFKIKK